MISRQTNAMLNAPEGWDVARFGEFSSLPVTRVSDCIFSYWKPSVKDRVRILFGSTIRLVVVGQHHPPVTIDTESAT